MPDNLPESQNDWTQEWTSGDRQLGKYLLRRKLGAGASGVVWLALDTFLNREVALKISRDPVVADRDFRRRFQREAQIACRLKHPHIATVLDANEHQDHVYVAYELVEGETLSEHLKGRSLDPKDALRITAQILSALQAAHGAKILHRDLSARNVMINRRGEAVVVDFGLAVASDQPSLSKENCVGTPGYMAPEVWEGKGPSEPSDLYSVGALLLQMLTGKSPKDVRNTTDSETIHDLGHAPNMVAMFVRRLAAQNPEDRFQSADEALGEILRIAKSEKFFGFTEKDIVSLRQLAHHSQPKKKIWIAGASAAVVVLTAFFALREMSSKEVSPDVSSVAVLPLSLASADETDLRPFADGLAETIVSGLSRVERLQVTPWVTSYRHRPEQTDLQKIGSRLGVDALITGTMREVGGRFQGSIALIHSRDGNPSWTLTFDRPKIQMSALQNEVTLGVVKVLGSHMGEKKLQELARGPTKNEGAIARYLQGTYLYRSGGMEANDLARIHLEEAVCLDPEFAEARVALGAVYSQRFYYGWGPLEDLVVASTHYKHALEIDPSLISAYRGLIHVYWEQAELENVLKIGKMVRDLGHDGAEERLARGEALFFGGLEEKSIPILESVITLDKENEAAAWFLVVANAWSLRFPEAIALAEDYEMRFEPDGEILTWKGFAYHALGDLAKAIESYERAIDLLGQSLNYAVYYYCALAYKELGRTVDSEECAREGVNVLQALSQTHITNPRTHSLLGGLLCFLGDLENAEREFALSRAQPWYIYPAEIPIMAGVNPDSAAEMWARKLDSGVTGSVDRAYLWALSRIDTSKDPRFEVAHRRFLALRKGLEERYAD